MKTVDSVTVETLLAHSDFVRSLAHVLVRDAATAEDACQQAWIEACERPPRHLESPRGWLATVTKQAARKLRRGEDRRATRERAAAKPERLPSTSEIAEREEARRKLVDAVLALEEPYRSAIVLRYLDELPPREVAARLRVPVETARTRIKRGLEQLRGKLDQEWNGDRRAWAMSLIPWAIPSTAKSAGKAAMIVAIAAGSLAVVTAAAWTLRGPGGGDGSGSLGAAPLTEATHQETDKDEVAQARRDPTQEQRSQRAAAPAPGKLELTASVARAIVTSRQPVVLTATFKNTGASPIAMFVPLHVPMVAFPRWEIVARDGSVYTPQGRPFQSMFGKGIQGVIHKIPAGQIWSTTMRCSGFRGVAKDGSQLPGRRLPVGTYRIRCSYEQATQEVPYRESMFDRGKQKVEGLWTGKVAARAMSLAVTALPYPNLTVRIPKIPSAGDPAVVEIIARNPTERPIELGELRLSFHVKAVGSASVAVPPSAIERVDGFRGNAPWTIPARGEFRARTDISRLALEHHRKKQRLGLYEIFGTGNLSTSIRWIDKATGKPIHADGFSIPIRRRAVDGRSKLVLEIIATGGTGVQLRLINRGDKAVRIRKRMSWPHDVRVSLRDADGKRSARGASVGNMEDLLKLLHPPARIVRGLAWNAARYDPVTPLTPGDFRSLEPGGFLVRDLQLDKLVNKPIPPGRYELRATWTSLVDGRHLGLTPAVVAVIRSKPIVLAVD